MPEDRTKIPHRYVVIVTRHGRNRTWRWQIVRSPMPLGVKLYEDNFHSQQAVEFSGETALHALLESVTKEAPDA